MTRAQPDKKQLLDAAKLIKQGEVVVFPTDTVYGIGCDPWNAEAIERLYAAKRRPEEKGLPILISDVAMLAALADGVLSAETRQIVNRYWPGALTVIVPRNKSLPDNIAPGDTIAIRLPDMASTRELIDLAGGAVATSSANISGLPAAVSADSAEKMLGDVVAAIVDGGTAPGGVASTILDCTQQPARIVRVGPIASAELEQLATSGVCT